VTVLVPLPPLEMVRLDGESETVMPGGTLTVREMVVNEVNEPDVPVIVTVAEPRLAVLLTVSVRTLVPFVGLAENTAVTPRGSPDAARFTLPANPFRAVTVIVEVPLAPGATCRDAGDGLIVKVGKG